jgi:uncharacterized protein YjbJ (UPF0337 family)
MTGTPPPGRNIVEEARWAVEGRMDEYKGRAKEAAGDLTDDERLQREGKADQASGKIKQTFENLKEKAEDVVDKARGRNRT